MNLHPDSLGRGHAQHRPRCPASPADDGHSVLVAWAVETHSPRPDRSWEPTHQLVWVPQHHRLHGDSGDECTWWGGGVSGRGAGRAGIPATFPAGLGQDQPPAQPFPATRAPAQPQIPRRAGCLHSSKQETRGPSWCEWRSTQGLCSWQDQGPHHSGQDRLAPSLLSVWAAAARGPGAASSG